MSQPLLIEKPHIITDKEKEELDKKVVDAIIWMQLPLNTLEHPGFHFLCESLHPGYTPCCRKTASQKYISNRVKSMTGQIVDDYNNTSNTNTNTSTSTTNTINTNTINDDILDTFSTYANMIDLYCKNEFKSIIISSQIEKIIQYIKRNHNVKQLFNEIEKNKYRRTIPLQNESKQWNSHFEMIKNFVNSREAIETLISDISNNLCEINNNAADNNNNNNINMIQYSLDFEYCKKLVSDNNWWNNVRNYYQLYEPFAEFIKKIESGSVTLSEVYILTRNIFDILSNAQLQQQQQQQQSLNNNSEIDNILLMNNVITNLFQKFQIKYDEFDKSLIFLSYYLDPHYKGMELSSDDINIAINKLYSYFPIEKKDEIDQELRQYSTIPTAISSNSDIFKSYSHSCIQWWNENIIQFRNIANAAIQLLSLPISAGAVGRGYTKIKKIGFTKKYEME